MRLLLTVVVTALSLHNFAEPRLWAQMRNISLDGIITYAERFDTVGSRPRLVADDDILIRKDSNYYYFGIHNSVVGASNLILLRGDTCTVMHISGSVTRAHYRVLAGDSLVVTKPILWITRNPEAWEFKGKIYYEHIAKTPRSDAEIKAELAALLEHSGYAATTIDMGSLHNCEIMLSRKIFKGAKVLIQYRKRPLPTGTLQTSLALYPPQPSLAAHIAEVQRFFAAEPATTLRLPLGGMDWFVVD